MKFDNCNWRLDWNYLEWQAVNTRIGSVYTQKDWNQTLVTKINQISAQINMSCLRGGADTIFIHPDISKLITQHEYYQPERNSLSGRYRVAITSDVPVNEVFICREEFFDLHYVSDRIYNTGEQQVVPLRDKYKTDEEVEEYRTKLMGTIKVSNYEQYNHEQNTINMGKKKILLCDIDGTICEDIPNEEVERMATAKLFPDAKEMLNKWCDDGDEIHFFTSRTEDMREITVTWLKENGFKYHTLIMGKPRIKDDEVYLHIDNRPIRAITHKGMWTSLVKKTAHIEEFATQADFDSYNEQAED